MRESSWAQTDVLFKTFKKKKRKCGHKANGAAGIKQHRSYHSSSFVTHCFLLFTCVIYSGRPALLCKSSVFTTAAWKALGFWQRLCSCYWATIQKTKIIIKRDNNEIHTRSSPTAKHALKQFPDNYVNMQIYAPQK